MNRVVIVDRPQPFRKNGVGRYLLEIATAVDRMPGAPPIKMLHLGRERSVSDWTQNIQSPPARWQNWLNQKVGLAWGLRRSSAPLIHYPSGTLHPNWDVGNAPRVLTLHGMGQYHSQDWYENWQRVRAERLHSRFARGQRKLSHVIAVSHYVKNQAVDALGLSPDDITVVPNGVDFNQFYQEQDREVVTKYLETHFGLTQPYWFHLGPGGPRKNVHRQLQAFATLNRDLPQRHKFVIAGLAGEAARERVRAEATELGISGDVIDMGEIRDDRRLRMLYNGAALFLFPSLYEGFGIPVIEAMACGTPVVTSATHSLPEASGTAAALVEDPTDVGCLTEAIRTLLLDEGHKRQLAVRGLAHARQFTWENSARGHVAVYRRVLQEIGE